MQRRLDISKLSSVGISHDMETFKVASKRYLSTFVDTFGGNPLRTQPFEWALGQGHGPFFCTVRLIGCLYL